MIHVSGQNMVPYNMVKHFAVNVSGAIDPGNIFSHTHVFRWMKMERQGRIVQKFHNGYQKCSGNVSLLIRSLGKAHLSTTTITLMNE